ncbi:hypothetical protein [Ornithinimicrobium sp. INDO-MA30-4]|uniref:hypothetical protein n=1 Tax=Ornithinimicrobium sp. INDO-MA30-4 TaxID=2908651 RepID=UPI001F40773C|nr:hypothetical protein [Ornithinimicrobium sp. INDO-MA30-4]UJH70742.1 hypothetical protein L0A91_01395 [Ornithinimicrobium sp. INDO-MA30-4]
MQRQWDIVREHPSGVLLVAQLIGILVFPFTESGGAGRTVISFWAAGVGSGGISSQPNPINADCGLVLGRSGLVADDR